MKRVLTTLLVSILCAFLLAGCGTKENKQKKSDDTKKVSSEAKNETKTEDSEELNEYGVTDAQLQVFVDNVKAAVTEEYLKPNNIDPATFSLPPAKVPMTEEDKQLWIQDIEAIFGIDEEEKEADRKKIVENMSERKNQFWNPVFRTAAFEQFSLELMAGKVSDTIQPLFSDEVKGDELAGVTDGYNLANILFREFVEWYKDVVCADGWNYEPMELIKQSESIEMLNLYDGTITVTNIGWEAFFADNISFE